MPRTPRSLAEACHLAGLVEPRTAAQLTEVYLRLVVAGIDHDRVGKPDWIAAMLLDAPREPTPSLGL